MKMEDKIINFDTAKLAKEKGFNIFTGKAWIKKENQELFFTPMYTDITNGVDYNAPTQSLLQKYLREVHNIHLYVWVKHGDSFKIVLINNTQNPYFFNEEYKSYEEALELGLQAGLEIIKQK